MASIVEWINALSALVTAGIAGIAAKVGLETFRSQRTASDVSLALDIFKEISRYWDRLSQGDGSYEYNMGQILAQFEIASGLFNNKTLSDKATIFLGDHIVEVFTQIQTSEEGKNLLDRCRSAHTTFVELNKFIANRMPQALNSLDFKSG